MAGRKPPTFSLKVSMPTVDSPARADLAQNVITPRNTTVVTSLPNLETDIIFSPLLQIEKDNTQISFFTTLPERIRMIH